ncbi:hypothetical protein PsYK624_018290 [Phanerochaete sordida]|uniref:Uncharacterized protein n=1 Tax=Phanerochaete sordida TaxID=48140 RepID=A0A9P3L862_9APHY|nr:hypothetical protein PsYK624_018290 [Phanerochaete sordida]
MSDRERLEIPEASSLDLDDDPRNSYMSGQSASPPEEFSEDESVTEEADGDNTEVHRVSAYGPKMTVHSRAPWEVDDDDEEQAEPDSAGIKGAFKFGRRDAAKKPWGRDIRHVPEPRPSLESLQSRGKQSFDTTSSHVSAGGALLALAQASMSSTSLAMSPSPQSSLREKLSLPRFRSRTPSNTSRLEPLDTRAASRYQASAKNQTPGRSIHLSSPTASEFSRPDSRPSLSDPPSPGTPSHHHEYHPYANPDLVTSYPNEPSPTRKLEELHALASASPLTPSVGRSESSATITESGTVTTMSTMSQSRSQGSSVFTPGTSVSSMHGTKESPLSPRPLARKPLGPIEIIPNPTVQSRTSDGSAQEVAIYNQPDFPSPSMPHPSWPQSPNPIPIKLISLEEAQAQARERSRSATATATSGAAASPTARTADPGFSQSAMNWTRMRSASSSGNPKGKNSITSASDLQHTPTLPSVSSLAGAAGAPPKVVTRKKSGFMRLFNSKEKMPASPPPVPSISADMLSTTTVTVIPSTPSIGTRSRKQSSHRVPVPSLTPSLLVDPEGSSGSSLDCSEDDLSPSSANPLPIRERQLSARRNAPGLHIVTSSPPPTSRSRAPTLVSGTDGQNGPLSTPQMTTNDRSLLSPADDRPSSDFLALNLRPVSMNFGEFSGQITDPDEFPRPSLDTDTGTPTTGASVISPRSPSPICKLEEYPSDVRSVAEEDQSSVIRVLQGQIISARKAWQHQLWELEGQVRDLKAEVEELRAKESTQEYCNTCGRGSPGTRSPSVRHEDLKKVGVKVGGVVNRPRARTGVGSRFGSAT